jgi:hypothetical protein
LASDDDSEQSGGDALDFTQQDPLPPDSLVPAPPDKPFDPEPSREKVRAHVTYGLTGTVCGLAVAAFVLIAGGWIAGTELDHAQFFFTPVITLAGTALGFYFGGKTGR